MHWLRDAGEEAGRCLCLVPAATEESRELPAGRRRKPVIHFLRRWLGQWLRAGRRGRPRAQPEAASGTAEALPIVLSAVAHLPPHDLRRDAVQHQQRQQAEEQQQEQQQEQGQEPQPRLPLSHMSAVTLTAQASLAAALAELRAAVAALPAQHSAHASGVARIEVPVPRSCCTTLNWLRGQQVARQQAAGSLLSPLIYFSPRRSTAPNTPGSEAAGAAAAGSGSVAGAGAAWLWRGEPGEALGEAVTEDMRRFLSAASPRLRAFGGARFDPGQIPAPEWAEFGSYCFFIPRLELTQASGCHLLACTVAWDAGRAPGPGGTGGSVSFPNLEAAVADALAALEAVQPPAAPAAGLFKLRRCGVRHVPEQGGWQELMGDLHATLQPAPQAATATPAAAAGGANLDACSPMLSVNLETAREEYLLNGQEGLDGLLAALDGGFQAVSGAASDGEDVGSNSGLTKVVLARRTDVTLEGRLDPLSLLEALQERDPRAYQVALQMPSGAIFLSSTPECLYARTGDAVASEAVAGTRARGRGGDVEQDFWLAFDLLRSHKDHVEFAVVRDWVQQALSGVCEEVEVEVPKSVLKQGAVQHLYGKLRARLRAGAGDAALLAALHPTPAVCGRPRAEALGLLAVREPFDRGYYAGPFGWVSQEAAEFVVAIRSALVQPAETEGSSTEAAAVVQRLHSHAAAGPGPGSVAAAATDNGAAQRSGGAAPSWRASLFAGVGIVRGSDAHSEWAELDLKVRQFERLLQSAAPLVAAPNINLLWAGLLVEELCRLGCNTFCVAPGSRSSPLTAAIAAHPRARLVPCIDERSLGFWALGYGRATGRPAAVVTTSGTAVANLLPAVVEAGQAGVPLLLLTGDRPAELRDTASNQTIDQVRREARGGSREGAAWAGARGGRATHNDAAPSFQLALLTCDARRILLPPPHPMREHLWQVKIFGNYTRWAADLPAATDQIPARSLLTTVDAAVAAAAAPAVPGPVHLNCQFREPLAPVAAPWDRACLAGLQRWEAGDQPFTTVAELPALPASALALGSGAGRLLSNSGGSQSFGSAAAAALAAIRGAQRGLIVVGELTHPEDVVAAAQLGRVLGWPLAADVLSGLRAGVQGDGASTREAPCVLGKASEQRPPAVVHHMDHLLLDRQHWPALRPDVVLQLGGRLTSKRLSQFLEWACLDGAGTALDGAGGTSAMDGSGSDLPATAATATPAPLQWVFVDRGCQRHDQFHLVTHRLQAALPLLAAELAGAAGAAAPQQAREQRAYAALLALLDAEASAAVDAALREITDLSEPQVARTLARALPPGEGLFVGNSMPIRDLDMYAAPPAPSSQQQQAVKARQAVVPTGLGAPVAANRGASGIDGVLSTAAGFADGLGRGCTLVVGDISFLHDVNGLHLLRSGEMRPPLTVVLINNSGGGIFSFLPIADAVADDVFEPLWATPQHVDLAGLCQAHGIPHQRVTATVELEPALASAWGLNRHSVIEVITDRGSNLDKHRAVQAEVQRAMHAALALVQAPAVAAGTAAAGPGPGSAALAEAAPVAAGWELRVLAASYERYSLPLAKPLTTSVGAAGSSGRREGLLLRVALTLPGGSNGAAAAVGVGEVAPLPGLHRESMRQAEQQAALLCELLGGGEVRVPLTVALLEGRFLRWLEACVGIAPGSLLPSVRSGLEAAVLAALAAHRGVPLERLLLASGAPEAPAPTAVTVNGLLDCQGTPEESAAEAAALVARHGYTALKLKVGRRADPLQDAAAVLAVRRTVGPAVALRADANRRWALEQALEFGRAAAAAALEYVEEPVAGASPWELEEFHRQTDIPVALDESVDEGLIGPGAEGGPDPVHGLAALVLKPSALGGMERTLNLAAWARQCGMRAMVSSSFESGLGLAQLAQLAAALDVAASVHSGSACAHGLATLDWFAQGLLPAALESSMLAGGAISLAAAQAAVSACAAMLPPSRAPLHCYLEAAEHWAVRTAAGTYDFRVIDTHPTPSDSSNGNNTGGSRQPAVLFLHGFLGASADWLPLMAALAAGGQRCVALDLPGHGSTAVRPRSSSSGNGAAAGAAYSLETAAAAVAELVQRCGLAGCTLVGYSLGGRLALLLAARWPALFRAAVVVSGTPGLEGAGVRLERAARDDALADALRRGGLPAFVEDWYAQPMWASLRAHPTFVALVGRRARGAAGAAELAAALAAMSPGRAPALWGELRELASGGSLPRLFMVAGEEDAKFAAVARRAEAELRDVGGDCTAVVLPCCGHAVHLERPAELLALLDGVLHDGQAS
eukprot:scaffold1.g5642.t1